MMRLPFILLLATAGKLALSTPHGRPQISAQQPLRSGSDFEESESVSQIQLSRPSSDPTLKVASLPETIIYTPLFEPPLSTSGRYILDTNGTRFKLASINWYGANDELFVPGGLEVQHRSTIAHTIRQFGFNSVRLAYSDEMVSTNPIIAPSLLAANSDLYLNNATAVRALDVFHAVVDALTDVGIAVIPNNYITSATSCCGVDPCNSAWYNDHLYPLCRVQQTEESWIENWETIMEPHIHNPLVVGADLRNEVRGVWGTMSWEKWARAAELAGDRLLRMNPNWIIFVGGIGSENFLDGARKRPVNLIIPNKVVYEVHVYKWSGWGSWQGAYGKRNYESFAKSMEENWGYLLQEETAPVWVGEFGVNDEPGKRDERYWANMIKYLEDTGADWGYSALNPIKPKSSERDGYGLLEDDWGRAVVDFRMTDLLRIMPESS